MPNTLYKMVPNAKYPGVWDVYKKYWFGWFWLTALAECQKDEFLKHTTREQEFYVNGGKRI